MKKNIKASSQWTKFLEGTEDQYSEYKNNISLRIETLLSDVIAELLTNPEYDLETAKKMAINLVIEQLLPMQYEITPISQKAMVISLLQDLPMLEEYRNKKKGNED